MNLGTETEIVEFKESTSELKEATVSIASILNKHGHGTLYFGVSSNGDVAGQEVAESTFRKISQAISNSISPTIYPEITPLQTDDGLTYIKVSFTGSERPYACSGRYRIRDAEIYILNNTRRRFVITGEGPREEIPELPRTAVREVLFNAFTHRDWLSQGSVQIDIFNDTVEIFSPGWFIEGQHPDDHLSGPSVSSLTRNPLIAETLYKSQDIEAYGTGIPRLRDELNAAEIAFEYVKMADGTKFVFYRNDAFFTDEPSWAISDKTVDNSDKTGRSSDKTVDNSDKTGGSSDKTVETPENDSQQVRRKDIPWDTLTQSEERACLFILDHGSASSKEIAAWNTMTPRGASQLLRRLVEKGILTAHGENRNRTYSLKRFGDSADVS